MSIVEASISVPAEHETIVTVAVLRLQEQK